jgi:aminoglycoside phosphotransferase (APT) family kinase protein
MAHHSEEFYHSAIKSAFPNSWEIRKPVICGQHSPVFLIDTPDGTKVCKFNAPEIVYHNRSAAQLLAMNDIPVPQTKVHAYMDAWFESYPYCMDKTLQEYINDANITNQQIFEAYKQAIDVQKKISEIDPIEFRPRSGKYFSDVFKTCMRWNMKNMMADFYAAVARHMSQYGEPRLLHNDIHAKNILINPEYKLTRIIDLDAIALCNDDFSVLQTFRSYPLDNYDEYMDYYESVMGRKLNRAIIMGTLKFSRLIRSQRRKIDALFWRGEFPKLER